MVTAKTKLKIEFTENVTFGTFDGLIRLQPPINREITREELAKIEWEENNKDEKKR